MGDDQPIYDDTYDTCQRPDDEHMEAFGKAGPMPLWYHQAIGRDEVERMLKGAAEGTFIIRDSSSSGGDFVMSVSETGAVRHYIIQRTGPTSFTLSDNQFSDLVELIAFYRVHILDTAALTVPVPFQEALKNGVQIRAFHSTTRAKFNFNGRDSEDLSFHKGELLNIIEKHEPEWWRAQSQETLQIGVVPSNYVVHVSDGPILIEEKKAEEAAKERAEMLKRAPAPAPTLPPRSTKANANKAAEEKKVRDEAEAAARAQRELEAAQRMEQERLQREAAERARQEELEARAREDAERQRREEEARRLDAERLAKERAESKRSGNYKPPERKKFIVAKAMLDRQANTFDKSALTFREGDSIQVTMQFENGLWIGQVMDGRRKGRKGHFPFTFVEILDSDEFDEDTKKVETEFKVKMLEDAGVDVTALLKAGQTFERPPTVPQRATKTEPAPEAAPAAAAPSVPARSSKSPPKPPAALPSRAPPPKPPVATPAPLQEDEDEAIYGGTAELFDQRKIDQMMEDIYGEV